MADRPINLILEQLNAIRVDISDMKEDIRNLKVRMTVVEEAIASTTRRLDRIERDVKDIKSASASWMPNFHYLNG